MVGMGTFLITVYVMVDDFCKLHVQARKRPGQKPIIDPFVANQPVVPNCLAVIGCWQRISL